jgi:parallel beta-helix repeat protein
MYVANLKITVIVSFFFLSTHISSQGTTLYVPDDYATIQEAIVASSNGDTIIVRPGLYQENIDFLGKAITLKSEYGPETTILDGNYVYHLALVTFKSWEDMNSVLDGFTLRRSGHGVVCQCSSPTILNNIITENYAISRGGGISCICASPNIFNNIISENYASKAGGIYCREASPILINNFVHGNWADSNGGIYCWDYSSPIIINNTVTNNFGGICCNEKTSVPIIINTIIWDNDLFNGCEIYGNPVVTYCDVKGGWPGTGNIDSDPFFVDPDEDDFHILYTSPCIDSGNNSAPYIPNEDFEGDPRIAWSGTVDMGADEFYTHLYYTGFAIPGGSVEARLIGFPGTEPVGLWFGSGVLDPPMPSMFGLWYLEYPWMGPIDLVSIPSPDGLLILPANLPPTPPAPYEVPMQALIGNELTNLSVLYVQ